MTLEEVKQAIRVDFDDDDTFITLLINAAEGFVKDSLDTDYDDENPRHRVLLIALVDDMYQNRSFTAQKTEKIRYIVRSISAQLRDGW